MDVFDAINQRRSVKAFDPSHRLSNKTARGCDPVKVAEIINLPSDYVIGFMLAVGKAVKPARPKGGQLDRAEVVVQDRFA